MTRAAVSAPPSAAHSLAPATVSASGHAGHRWPFGLGPRGFVLLAVGVVLIVPAWIDRRTLIALVVWDLLVLAAWAVDLRRIGPPARLRVARSWHGPLALGTSSAVTLALSLRDEVASPSNTASSTSAVSSPSLHPVLHAHLVDLVAGSLRRELPARDVIVASRTSGAPGAEARVEYDVEPRARGDLAMGGAIVRLRSPWGIATRWVMAALDQDVRVYPNLRDAQRHALFLVRSRQIAIEKRRARTRGTGREFDRLREHQDGDEWRDICWTAAARRGKLVTKVYQPERSQAVWVLVDAGRLLRARVDRYTKLDYGANSALALAQVAMASGDRVGLLAYGRRPQQRVAPGRGTRHLRALVDALAAVRSEAVEADHTAAASLVLSLQKRRALIVWITEVAETAGLPEVIESSQRMAPRHVVLLAVTRQPELTTLASARPASAGDMYRVMAAQQTAERREGLLHGLRQRGVLTLELPPGEMSAALVDRYLGIKERNLL